MEGLSKRAYAAHAGLSRGAVQKARKTGRLVLFAHGSIDAAASDARRATSTDPDQQMRARGAAKSAGAGGTGDGGNAAAPGAGSTSSPGDSASYLKARTALTVYQAQERQLTIQRKKGALVDRARAETLVFRLARQERDVWITWPTRVAALMAAQLSADMESASGTPVTIETAILQRVLEAHVREQLDALADRRVSLE
ncbi:hypothetical protein DZD18_09510 [Rhodobacteraceae bacterium W635]|uniref:hypothetical protein n=1 Tax=Nioella halotolerans TaxID=2303578 RepID=UPI000E3BA9AC|nr:hypothetical protein DZD18_09510 [Rhodobacteraceae bacterium W635]